MAITQSHHFWYFLSVLSFWLYIRFFFRLFFSRLKTVSTCWCWASYCWTTTTNEKRRTKKKNCRSKFNFLLLAFCLRFCNVFFLFKFGRRLYQFNCVCIFVSCIFVVVFLHLHVLNLCVFFFLYVSFFVISTSIYLHYITLHTQTNRKYGCNKLCAYVMIILDMRQQLRRICCCSRSVSLSLRSLCIASSSSSSSSSFGVWYCEWMTNKNGL